MAQVGRLRPRGKQAARLAVQLEPGLEVVSELGDSSAC